MDQAKNLRQMVNSKTKIGKLQNTGSTVFAIASGKGGVGKTNLVANLAISIASKGKSVAVLDADFGLANIDILLGLTPKYTIEHVLRGEKLIEDIVVEGPGGIKIIPASSGIEEMTKLTSEQFLRITTGLKQLSRDLDFMMIDTAAGISENVVRFLLASPNVILITSPEPPAIVDAYAVTKVLLKKEPAKRIKLVVNSVSGFKEAETVFTQINSAVKRFLNKDIDFYGYLFYDDKLKECVSNQQAVVLQYPQSKIAKTFDKLATQIIFEETENENQIVDFWKNLESEIK
jgi:flagellar biosynthesis protein FlhG